jgi:hypothetical protein
MSEAGKASSAYGPLSVTITERGHCARAAATPYLRGGAVLLDPGAEPPRNRVARRSRRAAAPMNGETARALFAAADGTRAVSGVS